MVFMAITSLTNAQAPVLGTTSEFALFSTNGPISSTGITHVTGNIGTNNGSNTNFGNVDGVMHEADGATAIAAAELNVAYLQLDGTAPTDNLAPLLGNGQSLNAGVYAIGAGASLTGILTLNGQGNANAVFIIQIEGAFSSAAGSQVLLTNGALACNVFWKIEGLVDLATNTQMKGTIVANNAAIVFNTGVQLEGRAFSTTGAITVAGSTVRTPLGCNAPELTGPAAPSLASAACYTIFSAAGNVTNTGTSFVTGDIGSNAGSTSGFQTANVTGTVHPNPDLSTAECASDLNVVYAYLSALPIDIELLYPVTFGNDLVLTPHTYLMSGAAVLTSTVYLNAQGNEDAVFVINITGAFSTSTYAAVELINGAQAKNVFWRVNGAVSLNDYTEFKGTVVGNNGAIILNTGVVLEGRATTLSGGISTFGIDAEMTPGCTSLAIGENEKTEAISIYPNPFASTINISLENVQDNNEIRIYNMLGALVLERKLNQNITTVEANLPSGVYLYQISNDKGIVQSGKLMAK